MKSIKHISWVVLLFLTTVTSCKKLDLVPTDRFTDVNYWTSTEKANSILNTAYSQMFNSSRFFLNEALSDNAYNGRGDNEGVATIASGTYDASLGRIKSEWNDHYSGIKTCNLFLDNVDRIENMDPVLKTRMKGEARFLRAFQYFQLMTWFGDVPLFDKDITLEESLSIGRSPRADVLAFILTELDAAIEALPINTAYAQADRGRISKGAALGLKARVYLYEGRWQDVATTCEAIMSGNNGSYSLFNSYAGLFLPQNENNSEVLLDFQFDPVNRTYNHLFDFVPISVGARLNALAPTQELVDSYLMADGKTINEAGSGYDAEDPYVNRDPRMTATIVYHNYNWTRPDGTTKTIYIKPGTDPDETKMDEYAAGGVSSPTGYYLRKYYDPTSLTNFVSGLNLILIRYADVLLMYAEARNELGTMDESIWNQTVGALRNRAGFVDPVALNFNASIGQAGIRTAIRTERRTELAMEGLRIFDIRRWKTAEVVLNGWAHGAKYGPTSIDNGYIRANLRVFDPGKHYLWPIPRDERNLNPNLQQNPGW
jgi:hypothetical protein